MVGRAPAGSYRPDIDGLRAVAVLAVVFCHYGFPGFSGGFVGVDIFFVISGFLITSILMREVEAGSFSIAAFYVRRIRRIYPAMVLVVACSLVAGWFLLWPAYYSQLGTSALFSLLGAANFYFRANTGYFDGEAQIKPLLHLWSLGVEEQFYLVWPLLLAATMHVAGGSRRRVALLLVAIIALSFGWAEYELTRWPANAFYLPHDRAWELAVGSLLACLGPPRLSAGWRTAAGVAGAASIAGCVVLLGPEDPFPGHNALLPCLGSALLIWHGTGQETTVSRALSSRPAVFVGKISYSLYLWHWPLIVFYRHHYGETTPPAAALLLVAATAAATLSWRYVETPLRHSSRRKSSGSAAIGTIAAAALASAALAILAVRAADPAFGEKVARVAAMLDYDPAKSYRTGICHLFPHQTAADLDLSECLPGSGSNAAVIWGDSTVVQFDRGLEPVFASHGLALGVVSLASCPPALGYDGHPNCRPFNEAILRLLLERKPRWVILGGGWLPDEAMLAGLERTIDRLHEAGIGVMLFGRAPLFLEPVPIILAKRLLAGDTDTRSRPGDIQPALFPFEATMSARFASKGTATYIPVLALLCPGMRCELAMDDGLPAYFDRVHLTEAGSDMAARKLAAALPLADARGSN